jgi:hypothetical protein
MLRNPRSHGLGSQASKCGPSPVLLADACNDCLGVLTTHKSDTAFVKMRRGTLWQQSRVLCRRRTLRLAESHPVALTASETTALPGEEMSYGVVKRQFTKSDFGRNSRYSWPQRRCKNASWSGTAPVSVTCMSRRLYAQEVRIPEYSGADRPIYRRSAGSTSIYSLSAWTSCNRLLNHLSEKPTFYATDVPCQAGFGRPWS